MKIRKATETQQTPTAEAPSFDKEELEKWVEEATQEIQETPNEDIETPNEDIEKEFDEVSKLIKSECEVAEQATNNEIVNECLKNRSKTQDVKNDVHSLRVKESEHFIEIMKELHFIKKHMNKVAVITMGIVFAGGYIFGTQHEHISPYIGKVLDLMNLFKGNGGQ